MRALGTVSALALVGLVAAGCDNATAPGEPAAEVTPDTFEQPETIDNLPETTPDVAVEEDTTQADTAPPDDVPAAVAYPEGPYGTGYIDIIDNLEFFDPWSGEVPRLSDYHNDPNVKVLLIASAAGWCTACMYEAWDLVEVYDKYKDDGLEILYTLYEDPYADPLFQDGDSDAAIDADLSFFSAWQNQLGKHIGLPLKKANYKTVVDRNFVLEPYYNEGATPLTVIVRTSDMRILYRSVGYSAGTIDQLIRGFVN